MVLRIDSPGGSAFASDAIRRELDLVKQAGKPLVVSMGSMAASGGYWIATGAEEIWAAPTTVTGSIGIFSAFPTFERSLEAARRVQRWRGYHPAGGRL
ncbi:MAG: S49 family peptidase [Desulfobacterales bacterium]|nr:S49 family peptidase [Desulfobacterales bacterium]